MSEGHQFSQYSEKVIEHFTNPRNLGEIIDADGIGEIGNARCGDVMQLFIKIKDDKIDDAKFKTFGCCAAIATSSMITEMNESLRAKARSFLDSPDSLNMRQVKCFFLELVGVIETHSSSV